MQHRQIIISDRKSTVYTKDNATEDSKHIVLLIRKLKQERVTEKNGVNNTYRICYVHDNCHLMPN